MVLAFISGLALGIFFFGGLWLTVRAVISSKIPGLLTMISFFVRTAIVLLGFYFVSAGDWRKLLISLSGFVIARLVVNRVLKQAKKTQKEGGMA
jgi:F1F0 ATPase subunit 2